MKYRFNYNEGIIEFSKNRGRALLEAKNEQSALNHVSDLFRFLREPFIEEITPGKYQVNFKVSFDFRRPLLKTVEKALKRLRSKDIYSSARYLDRYIVATICDHTNLPEWLALEEINLKNEISSLRKASIIAREVSNIREFVDYDIVIHNYIELNSKEGYKSRVVRTIQK